MRSPPTWCTERRLELSDSTIENNGTSPGSSDPTCGPPESLSLPKEVVRECMNDLPPEVLSEIFFWCTPTANDQDSRDSRAALFLSHVCRYWRSITLSSPQLWTYIKVRVMQGELQPALNMVALYLKRSGSLPIFIDVDFIDLFSYYRPVLDLFEQVVSEAREVRPPESLSSSFLATHLELSSTEDRPTREEWYFWSARPAPPQAVDAGNEHGSYMRPANTPASPEVFQSTVTIRALRVAVGSFVLEPYLPWASSLTFLILRDLHDFTNLDVAEAARILSSFPLLIHCSLHVDFESTNANALGVDSIQLRYLKSFSLSWVDWIDTGPLLDALSAPELRELELIGRLPDTDTGGVWHHLVQFLRRNNPPLSHIILEQIDCFHIAFLSILPLIPNLEGLWLEDCLLDESIIRGLVPILSGNLKTLVMLECYTFDIEELVKVLKSIGHPGSMNVKVYVDGCGDVNPTHIEMIREMGLVNLEIGPSSMPFDMDEEEADSNLAFT